MQQQRWVNQSQPPYLFNANILLYLNAVFGLVLGSIIGPFALLGAPAGWGIANEKKWGYAVGIFVAALPLVFEAYWIATGQLGLGIRLIIPLIFQLLLLYLLLHITSRSYVKIWFK